MFVYEDSPETLIKYGISGYFKANRYYDKSTIRVSRQHLQIDNGAVYVPGHG